MIFSTLITRKDGSTFTEYRGLHSDNKPVYASLGDVFMELDSDVKWGFTENGWVIGAHYETGEAESVIEELEEEIDTLSNAVTNVYSYIPPQASAANKLADKEFVNSSVATNTAFFRGTYDLVDDLGLTTSATEEEIAAALATEITEVTNNDYSFVFYENETTGITEYYDRYKYSSEDESWSFEFRLNNSSFTAEQWAAINSGMTAALTSNVINGNIPYMTTAPSEANTNGIKIVVLAAEPATKYDGYLYLIKDVT